MNMWLHLIENLSLKHRQTRQHIPPFLPKRPGYEKMVAINQRRAAETKERNYRENLEILRTCTFDKKTWTISSIKHNFSCCEDGIRRLHNRLELEGIVEKVKGDGEVHTNLWSWK